ncbi:hypothetical protein [Hymenobacter sp. BRD67]|uniref:hypothetical protein n=1 Tax=Hymenobacter sp. BRD67 TaxID=2675877 RepID=UPI001565A022|nr:hypothetical protein [Hymenobacter sp. BRD67]QKG51236.1 hypothetical protein GKZ67_00780 [Hymenobacter sp. BRD67]
MPDSALAERVAVPAATRPLPFGYWCALIIAGEGQPGGILQPCAGPTSFMPDIVLTLSKFLL